MASKPQELSTATLAWLEEEFRSKPYAKKKMAEAIFAQDWKPEDLNDWIKGQGGRSEPILNGVIKKESNKSYCYYEQLLKDTQNAYNSLSIELQGICDSYLWGQYSYMTWADIADNEDTTVSKMYRKRYKILEALAKEKGILIE